ncbi:MAG: hypothetical protein ACOC1P_02300 [Minisyncoccales bacterium]
MNKVEFSYSKEYDAEMIFRFVNPEKGDWDWSEKVFEFHPHLKEKLKGIKNKQEKKEIVKNYINDWFNNKENLNELNKRIKEIEKQWRKIEDKYFNRLFSLLDLKKPKKRDIKCYVSINPICPRDLNRDLFSVFYKYSLNHIMVLIAHEILHFYYFDKWREVFPDSDKKTFEGPHIIWHLSEIMAPILLAQPQMQELLNKLDTGYQEHGKIIINGKNIIEHFDELYNEFDRNKDFSEFLEQAYKEIKKYKKELYEL